MQASVVAAQNDIYGVDQGPPLLPHGDDVSATRLQSTLRQRQKRGGNESSSSLSTCSKSNAWSQSTLVTDLMQGPSLSSSLHNHKNNNSVPPKADSTPMGASATTTTTTTTTTTASSGQLPRKLQELQKVFPTSELPGGFPPELAFRALAAFGTIRTLSLWLRLSPFTPNVFLRALLLPFPNRLLGQIHVAILRALLPSLHMGYHWPSNHPNHNHASSSTNTKSPPLLVSKKRKRDGLRWPLRAGDNLEYLDPYTWPLFCDDYAHLVADLHHGLWHDEKNHVDLRNLDISMVASDLLKGEARPVKGKVLTKIGARSRTPTVPTAGPEVIYLHDELSEEEDEDELEEDADEFKPKDEDEEEDLSLTETEDDDSFVVRKSRSNRKVRVLDRKPRSGRYSTTNNQHQNTNKKQLLASSKNQPPRTSSSASYTTIPVTARTAGASAGTPQKVRAPVPAALYISPGRKIAKPSPFLPFSSNATRSPGGVSSTKRETKLDPDFGFAPLEPSSSPGEEGFTHVIASSSSTTARTDTSTGNKTAASSTPAATDASTGNNVTASASITTTRPSIKPSTKPAGNPSGPKSTHDANCQPKKADTVSSNPPPASAPRKSELPKTEPRVESSKIPCAPKVSSEKREQPEETLEGMVQKFIRGSVSRIPNQTNQVAPFSSKSNETVTRSPEVEALSQDADGYRPGCAPLSDTEHDTIWPHFKVLEAMRGGTPYHSLSVEEKIVLLEFLLDDLLALDTVSAEMRRRNDLNGYERPYGPLPFPKELAELVNDDYCAVCRLEGDLLCCDGCTSSFHRDCISQDTILPDGNWYCPECTLVDSAKFGPLKGGRKSRLDWFELQPDSPPGVSNAEQLGPHSTQYLVIHGFVFCRQRETMENSLGNEWWSPPTLLSRNDLLNLFQRIGIRASSTWPVVHVPCDRGSVWKQLEGQPSRKFLTTPEAYDPSAYKSLYRKAPLEGVLRRIKDPYLSTYEHQCFAVQTHSLSSKMGNCMERDDMIVQSMRKGYLTDFGIQMVRGYMTSIERNLCKSYLLAPSWGVSTSGKSWVSQVGSCSSINGLCRLLVVLVDSIHSRVFTEGWYRCPTTKPSGNEEDTPTLLLSPDITPQRLVQKREWERCQLGNVHGLLYREGKRLVEWIAELRPDLSVRQRGNKRKNIKERGSLSPARTSNSTSPNKSDESTLKQALFQKDPAATSGEKDSKANATPVKVSDENEVSKTDNAAIDGTRVLRRSNRTSLDGLSSSNKTVVGSADLEKLVLEEMQASLEVAVEGLDGSSFVPEQSWPIAGRRPFDPIGRLPAKVTRRLARRGGNIQAPFVVYAPHYEVGQVSFYHVWRKRVLGCHDLEELLVLIRMLASSMDSTTIHRAAALARNIKKLLLPRNCRIVSCHIDAKDGEEYFLVADKSSRAKWVSFRDVDLELLIQNRYGQRQKAIEKSQQRTKANSLNHTYLSPSSEVSKLRTPLFKKFAPPQSTKRDEGLTPSTQVETVSQKNLIKNPKELLASGRSSHGLVSPKPKPTTSSPPAIPPSSLLKPKPTSSSTPGKLPSAMSLGSKQTPKSPKQAGSVNSAKPKHTGTAKSEGRKTNEGDPIHQYNDILREHHVAYQELLAQGSHTGEKLSHIRAGSYRRLERLMSQLGSSMDKKRFMNIIISCEESDAVVPRRRSGDVESDGKGVVSRSPSKSSKSAGFSSIEAKRQQLTTSLESPYPHDGSKQSQVDVKASAVKDSNQPQAHDVNASSVASRGSKQLNTSDQPRTAQNSLPLSLRQVSTSMRSTSKQPRQPPTLAPLLKSTDTRKKSNAPSRSPSKSSSKKVSSTRAKASSGSTVLCRSEFSSSVEAKGTDPYGASGQEALKPQGTHHAGNSSYSTAPVEDSVPRRRTEHPQSTRSVPSLSSKRRRVDLPNQSPDLASPQPLSSFPDTRTQSTATLPDLEQEPVNVKILNAGQQEPMMFEQHPPPVGLQYPNLRDNAVNLSFMSGDRRSSDNNQVLASIQPEQAGVQEQDIYMKNLVENALRQHQTKDASVTDYTRYHTMGLASSPNGSSLYDHNKTNTWDMGLTEPHFPTESSNLASQGLTYPELNPQQQRNVTDGDLAGLSGTTARSWNEKEQASHFLAHQPATSSSHYTSNVELGHDPRYEMDPGVQHGFSDGTRSINGDIQSTIDTVKQRIATLNALVQQKQIGVRSDFGDFSSYQSFPIASAMQQSQYSQPNYQQALTTVAPSGNEGVRAFEQLIHPNPYQSIAMQQSVNPSEAQLRWSGEDLLQANRQSMLGSTAQHNDTRHVAQTALRTNAQQATAPGLLFGQGGSTNPSLSGFNPNLAMYHQDPDHYSSHFKSY